MNEINNAFSRVLLYHALALGFRPPTNDMVDRLVCGKEAKTLEDAASLLDPSADSGLVATTRQLRVTHIDSLRKMENSYQRLFGHTARGPVPPYETEYGTEGLFQQPHAMGDLMAFYRAFGLTLNSTEHERADHISCECEFLSFLALKEVYALEREDISMLEETRKAARLFLQDHLGRFAPSFTKKLTREDSGGFYGALGELCYHVVTKDCERYGVPVGSGNVPLRPAGDDGVPMACGTGADCAAIPGSERAEEFEDT